MVQVPDVNNSNSFYLGTPVLANGQAASSPSLADNLYQNFISADSLNSGVVATAKDAAQNAPIAASKYQASVQAAIDAFIASLLNGTKGNVNLILNVLNSSIGSAGVPNSTAIDNQYDADAALVAQAANQVNGYNDYVATFSEQSNSGIVSAITNIVTEINSINDDFQSFGSSHQPVDVLISGYLAQYNTDIANADYTAANTDMQNAIAVYTSISGLGGLIGNAIYGFNSAVYDYYVSNPPDSGYSQAAWNAAQAAITARNNDESLVPFYGTLANLPPFQGLSSIPSFTAATPNVSSFGFPSTVDANTNNTAVQASFESMIQTSIAIENDFSSINSATNSSVSVITNPTTLQIPTMPTPAQYFDNVTQQIAIFFTASTFQALLGLLGVQNNASAQALTAALLSTDKGSATILLTNPSGGAVTGATLSSVANSAFVQAYADALAKELLREAQTGETYQTPAGIRPTNTQASDPNALPSGITGANAALETAPADPGTSTGVGILGNLPALTSDFAALLGQFSVLAAINVLQSDSTVSTQDTQTVQSEFLVAVSNFISNFSTTDLDNRITALLQAQGVTVSQADLDAINKTANQFLTSLQGAIANNVSGQINLATSAIGAQVASQYVQSTFQEAKQTQLNQQQQQAAEQNSDQQLQTLLANLPQSAYLSGPAGLAQQAEANGGAGQNGSLGLALAGVLPKDANGNFESVTPTQLYNSLVAIQGQPTGSATFFQFIQNEPSYQLDEITSSNANRSSAGKLNARLQVNQQTTLAATANKNYANSLAQLNSQFDAEASTNQTQASLITNPTLSAYYEKKLLPGKTLLNIGLQTSTSQFANTPSAKNTTLFPV